MTAITVSETTTGDIVRSDPSGELLSLSEYQQKLVWDGMLDAETRAQYFAYMSVRYQRFQRYLTVTTLVLTSGATLSFVTFAFPQSGYGWVPKVLGLLATIGSTWSMVARYERNAMGMTEIHRRWNTLAFRYRNIWANMYDEQAPALLEAAEKDELAISADSTAFVDDQKLMAKCQANVNMHHGVKQGEE